MLNNIQSSSGELWLGFHENPNYTVSNMGRIFSIRRSIVLTPFLNKKTGYMQVDMSGKRYSVHRVVGKLWVKGFFDGAVIDHLNGVRTDNRSCNLEWVTYGENSKRSYKMGRKPTCLGKFSSQHHTSKPVIASPIRGGVELEFDSGMDAVRLGFSSSGITRSCQGKISHHKGYKWRYANDH